MWNYKYKFYFILDQINILLMKAVRNTTHKKINSENFGIDKVYFKHKSQLKLKQDAHYQKVTKSGSKRLYQKSLSNERPRKHSITREQNIEYLESPKFQCSNQKQPQNRSPVRNNPLKKEERMNTPDLQLELDIQIAQNTDSSILLDHNHQNSFTEYVSAQILKSQQMISNKQQIDDAIENLKICQVMFDQGREQQTVDVLMKMYKVNSMVAKCFQIKGKARDNLEYLKQALQFAQKAHKEEMFSESQCKLLLNDGQTSTDQWSTRAICETMLSMTKSILGLKDYSEALVYSLQSTHWAQGCAETLREVLYTNGSELMKDHPKLHKDLTQNFYILQFLQCLTMMNSGHILQKFRNYDNSLVKFKQAEALLYGSFQKFSVLPIPEFDNIHEQQYQFEKKFVQDCLLSQSPENIKQCEALMRDLQKMIKRNSVNNSYKDEINQKKHFKIEETILHEQSQMSYIDRSIENIFTKVTNQQKQTFHNSALFHHQSGLIHIEMQNSMFSSRLDQTNTDDEQIQERQFSKEEIFEISKIKSTRGTEARDSQENIQRSIDLNLQDISSQSNELLVKQYQSEMGCIDKLKKIRHQKSRLLAKKQHNLLGNFQTSTQHHVNSVILRSSFGPQSNLFKDNLASVLDRQKKSPLQKLDSLNEMEQIRISDSNIPNPFSQQRSSSNFFSRRAGNHTQRNMESQNSKSRFRQSKKNLDFEKTAKSNIFLNINSASALSKKSDDNMSNTRKAYTSQNKYRGNIRQSSESRFGKTIKPPRFQLNSLSSQYQKFATSVSPETIKEQVLSSTLEKELNQTNFKYKYNLLAKSLLGQITQTTKSSVLSKPSRQTQQETQPLQKLSQTLIESFIATTNDTIQSLGELELHYYYLNTHLHRNSSLAKTIEEQIEEEIHILNQKWKMFAQMARDVICEVEQMKSQILESEVGYQESTKSVGKGDRQSSRFQTKKTRNHERWVEASGIKDIILNLSQEFNICKQALVKNQKKTSILEIIQNIMHVRQQYQTTDQQELQDLVSMCQKADESMKQVASQCNFQGRRWPQTQARKQSPDTQSRQDSIRAKLTRQFQTGEICQAPRQVNDCQFDLLKVDTDQLKNQGLIITVEFDAHNENQNLLLQDLNIKLTFKILDLVQKDFFISEFYYLKSQDCKIFDVRSFQEQFVALSRQALKDFSFEQPPFKLHFEVIKEVMKFAIDPQEQVLVTQTSDYEFLCQPKSSYIEQGYEYDQQNVSEIQIPPYIASSVFDVTSKYDTLLDQKQSKTSFTQYNRIKQLKQSQKDIKRTFEKNQSPRKEVKAIGRTVSILKPQKSKDTHQKSKETTLEIKTIITEEQPVIQDQTKLNSLHEKSLSVDKYQEPVVEIEKMNETSIVPKSITTIHSEIEDQAIAMDMDIKNNLASQRQESQSYLESPSKLQLLAEEQDTYHLDKDVIALNQVSDKITKSFQHQRIASRVSSKHSMMGSEAISHPTSGNITSGLFTSSEHPGSQSQNDSEIDEKFAKKFDNFISNIEEENLKEVAAHRQTVDRTIQIKMLELAKANQPMRQGPKSPQISMDDRIKSLKSREQLLVDIKSEPDLGYKDFVLFPDESIYRGQFTKVISPRTRRQTTVRQGYGQRQFKDGSNYEGNWADNTPNKFGTFQYADGSCYKGQFVKGVMMGQGELTLQDGTIQKGLFKDNRYME